jgi:hypothetical protein
LREVYDRANINKQNTKQDFTILNINKLNAKPKPSLSTNDHKPTSNINNARLPPTTNPWAIQQQHRNIHNPVAQMSNQQALKPAIPIT